MANDNSPSSQTLRFSRLARPLVILLLAIVATGAAEPASAMQMAAPARRNNSHPIVPSGLSASAVSSSQISLSWNASTDPNYQSSQITYGVYRSGARVATTAAGVTAFADTGLTASTTYSYTVSAYDPAGNDSAQSSAVQATTAPAQQDTIPPTVSITSPANNQTLSGATNVAANANDNVGVVGVQFQLDGASLGAEITTSPYAFTWDTTKTANGTHILTAVARDAAGNRTTSSGVTVTTSNSASTRPYSTSFPLTENPISENGNWINGKAVGLDWGDVQTTPGLAFGTNSGNYADSTALVSGSWGPDQMAQATVHSVNQTDSVYEEVELRLRSAISAHSITGYEINFRCSKTGNAYSQVVKWNGPLGNFTYLWGVDGGQYGVADKDVVKATMIGNVITVYINNVQIGQVADSTYTAGSPGMGFYLDGATGINADYGFTNFLASDELTNDSTPPSVPANLSANVISSSEIDLNWSASTDNVAVTGYRVFRNSTQVASTSSPGFADKTVAPGTQYSYTVSAFDAAGNTSAQSSPVVATTPSGTDITPPSVPTNLQASSVTSTSLTLAWSASTDNVAVAGYRIFRNGSQVGTTTATSYADTGLLASTTYAYTVEAYDSSNNVSAQSQQLTVTTLPAAATPPSMIQVNQNQISSGASTSVAFKVPTQAGNTIVAYVIWNNAGSVALTDSRGDTFVNVGTPVSWGSGYSAQVFYASNIAGGADTVTASFRTSVTSFGVVYVHEYAGISAVNPVDVTASASGSSSSLNSGPATTTSANDLVFGAGVSDNTVTAAGSGFVSRDLAYGNITEDRSAATAGPCSATATHNGKMWGMQMVAFRAAQ